MIETYKIVHGFYDQEVSPSLSMHTSTYTQDNCTSKTRGHPFKLYKTRFYKDIGKFAFSNRIFEQWNSLSAHVVTAESVNQFKNRLDKYLGDQPLLYDFEAKFQKPRPPTTLHTIEEIQEVVRLPEGPAQEPPLELSRQ